MDGEGTTLQALQTPQQQQQISEASVVQPHEQHQPSNMITNITPQTSDPLGVEDSNLMTGVNQHYLASATDVLDENRGDTIIQDGQFTLNTAQVGLKRTLRDSRKYYNTVIFNFCFHLLSR